MRFQFNNNKTLSVIKKEKIYMNSYIWNLFKFGKFMKSFLIQWVIREKKWGGKKVYMKLL